jgi:hypothetical protein
VQASELPGLLRAGVDGEVVWAEVERALDDLVAAVARDRARAIVVLAPSRLQIAPEELEAAVRRAGARLADYDATRPNRRLAEWAAARGVPLVDLTPAFSAAAARGERLHLVSDTHWNLRGNGLAGLALARALVELGVVPPRPASDAAATS